MSFSDIVALAGDTGWLAIGVVLYFHGRAIRGMQAAIDKVHGRIDRALEIKK